MSDGEKVVFILIGMIMTLLIATSSNQDMDDDLKKCEAKGGTLLHNTYKVGKNNQHERLCVSSEFVLNSK